MKAVHKVWRPAVAVLAVVGLVGTATFAARQNPSTLLKVSKNVDGPIPVTAAITARNYSTGFEATETPSYATLGYISHVNGFFPAGCGSVAAPCWGHTTGAGFSLITPTISTANPFAGTPGVNQHLRLTPDPSTRTNQPGFGLGVDARFPRTAFLDSAPVVPNTVSAELAISNLFGQDFRFQPQSNSQGFLATSTLFYYTGAIYVLDEVPCGGSSAFYGTGFMWDSTGAYQNMTVTMDPCNNVINYYYGGALIYTGCVYAGSNLEQFLIFGDNYFSPGSIADVDNLVMETSPWTECPTDCDGDGILDDLETNPAERDCDRDGVCNGVEIANCTLGDSSCTDCNGNSIPDGCEQGACCLDPNGDGIYEGCADDTGQACAAASGIFRGPCKHCPTQNVAIIPEAGGGVFVHVIGPPIDCIAGTSLAARDGCPLGGPFYDAWKSVPDASMCHNFGASGQSIPADFFNPGSDVFAGSLCLAGVPLGAPGFGEADTLIQRSADPFDRCSLPSPTPVSVQIDIFALSLAGTAPVIVTYNGGQNPELWSVAVDLSSVIPPSGTLTGTKSHCNGGTYTSVLNVQPRFTFTKVSDGSQVRVLDTGLAGIPYVTLDQQTPAPWVHDVDPNLGLSGDPCTHFHAGIDDQVHQTACDCNENLTRDECEIEQGAADCNLNQVLDECEFFTCDDSNPCTDDVCTFGVGCEYEYNTLPCNDGNACTTNDACSAGACVGGPPLDCDDDNVCTDDSCDPPTTGCVHLDNVAPCDDGSACTTNDACSAGACAGGPPLDCDDGNVCTDDSCDPATGCMHTNNTAQCNDGKFCTVGDICGGGACNGTLNPCSDGVDCTVDSCIEATDSCTHVANDSLCDDRLWCNGAEICDPTLGCQDGADPCEATQTCYEDKDDCFDNIIPTVSEWGLVILTLLLLTGAKIYFSRRTTATD